MTIVIKDNGATFTKYSAFISRVDGLISAYLPGNGSVANSLRLSALNGLGNLGEMIPSYSSYIALNDSGGVTITAMGSGGNAGRLAFPYVVQSNDETCITIVSALNTPTYTQICAYAGYRLGLTGTGGVEAVNSTDATKIAVSNLELVNKGYISPTEGLKSFVIISELRTIPNSGVRLTGSLHALNGEFLATAAAGIDGVVLNLGDTPAPYIGGTKSGATAEKSATHYGHLIFYRQLTDLEKVTASEQLAGYANSIGANIA